MKAHLTAGESEALFGEVGNMQPSRDAKQFWSLEDFMNVNQTAVANAVNLSFFMINLSQVLLDSFRQTDPEFWVLDLKSYYRGGRYETALLKVLPETPDVSLVAQFFRNLAALGSIHLANWRRY